MVKINYIEVREKETRKLVGIIDTAKSVIWKSVYYGVGKFEIYVRETPANISMLSIGNYVTREDTRGKRNDECGVIERVEITDNKTDGRMITASGRFVKSILDRRIIFTPTLVPPDSGLQYYWSCAATILTGNVEKAVRKVVYDNAVNATGSRDEVGSFRNIPEIYWTDDDVSGIPDTIVSEDESGTETSADKQVTYKNLLEYTDGILQEYSCGARMWLDRRELRFRYQVFKGEDRTRTSTTNQPLIFSREFDNLIGSSYLADDSASKTTALIGGEGEGTERKCAFAYAWKKGLDRRETFVDASSLSSTYKEGETEKTYTNEEYRKQLETLGRQTVASLAATETMSGTADMTNSGLEYGIDYNLGDMVTIQDDTLRKYIDTRILVVTEVQDDGGYSIDIEFGL